MTEAQKPSTRTAALSRAAAVVGMVVGVAAVAAPLGARQAMAAISPCTVINSTAGASYTNLQSAVTGAHADATLLIRGTCHGSTEIDKVLRLVGRQPSGFTQPTLFGGLHGSVLSIARGTAVSVTGLSIEFGNGTHDRSCRCTFGGGVLNWGSLTLTSTNVANDSASLGGGIMNFGTLTATGLSVSGGTADVGGGVANLGTFILGSGDVSANYASIGGGVENRGTLVIAAGGSITSNHAINIGGVDSSGDLMLAGAIDGNEAYAAGGLLNTGTAVIDGGHVDGNYAQFGGGGVINDATLHRQRRQHQQQRG